MPNCDVHELHRLPGVKAERVKGTLAKTPTGFLAALQEYRACSDVGDNGSVIVYRDDAGAYRCAFMQWKVTKESQTYTSKAKVRAWLKEWLPMQE